MTTLQATEQKVKTAVQEQAHVFTGAAAAAFIGSGIGVFVMGFLTTLSEASSGIANLLNWIKAAGPLSGKTGVSVIVWIVSWLILNNAWKGQDYDLKKAFTITLVLIGLGFLLTFPPFFVLFAAE